VQVNRVNKEVDVARADLNGEYIATLGETLSLEIRMSDGI
jgi:hypothetical protein